MEAASLLAHGLAGDSVTTRSAPSSLLVSKGIW